MFRKMVRRPPWEDYEEIPTIYGIEIETISDCSAQQKAGLPCEHTSPEWQGSWKSPIEARIATLRDRRLGGTLGALESARWKYGTTVPHLRKQTAAVNSSGDVCPTGGEEQIQLSK
jgi:hypothetical protein